MSLLDTLYVALNLDAKNFDSGIEKAKGQTSAFANAMSGMAMGAGIAAFNILADGARNMVAGLGDAATAASDLGETVNMMNVVMGDAAAATMQWSTTATDALGMSQQQALRAAGTFAAFGKATGLAGEDLTQFSTGLVGLATDLGSLYNTSPDQAIMAIGAALRGESEPIRAYNILLDEATLRQAALTLGIVDNIKTALTPQQRVLAAEAELWRQSADARGDYANTSGGLAGQQKELTARMADFSAVMGQAFLPVVLQTTTALNTGLGVAMPYISSVVGSVLVPALNSGITAFTNFIGAQMGISTAFDGSQASVKAFTTVFAEAINNQIEGFNAAILATAGWQMASTNALAQVGWEWNEFIIKFAVQINRIVGGLNTAIAGMNAVGKFGNPSNPSIPSIPTVGVPYSQVMPTAGAAPGAGDVFQIPALKIDWDATVTLPATTAAKAAGQALATTVGNFSQATGGAMDDLAGKLRGALNSVPGIGGISPVTQSDLDKAAAGMAINKADTWRARAEDELRNGIDWAEIDPAAVAASLGLDPALPAAIIADELNRQWASGEYFADASNALKIDWTAVQAKLDADARAVLGQKNILAEAIKQGITLDSMAPVTGQTATTLTDSFNSPVGVVALNDSGAAALEQVYTGFMDAAAGKPWYDAIPKPPTAPTVNGITDFTGIDPLTGKPFGLTIGPKPIGPQLPTTERAGASATSVTINNYGVAADPAAYGRASELGVRGALRARGR